MKIIVLNLPKDIKEVELTKMFKIYGEVESCNLVMDNKSHKSKGFGFIEMANDSEADVAIIALHGKRVRGNKIRVKVSEEAK